MTGHLVDNTSSLHDSISSDDENDVTANSLDTAAQEKGTEQSVGNAMLLNVQRELAAVKMNNTLSNSAATSSSVQSTFGCELVY